MRRRLGFQGPAILGSNLSHDYMRCPETESIELPGCRATWRQDPAFGLPAPQVDVAALTEQVVGRRNQLLVDEAARR